MSGKTDVLSFKKKYFFPVVELPSNIENEIENEYNEKLNFLFDDDYVFMKQLFEMGFKDFDFNLSKLREARGDFNRCFEELQSLM